MIHILLRGNKILLLGAICLCKFSLHAQNPVTQDTNYIHLIKKAEAHLVKKEYLFANNAYNKALMINSKSVSNLFNHGWCYSQRALLDSSYVYWKMVYQIDWEFLYQKTKEKKVWTINLLESKKIKGLKDSLDFKYASLDTVLINDLKQIHFLDQLYRGFLSDTVRKEFGRGSLQDKIILDKRRLQDTENLEKTEKIITKYGYPSINLVGKQYVSTVFFVVQHSNTPTMKKYLPLFKEAANKGNLSLKTLALMEDRVMLAEGKKQIYGTQIFTDNTGSSYVRPIEDPDNLDKRRIEIGLSPISEYVKRWNIKWNLEEYKLQLPEIEERERKNKL